jgi:hypothetical protein
MSKMHNIKVNIWFYDELLESDVETLVYKGLDTDQNVFEAINKNMMITVGYGRQ